MSPPVKNPHDDIPYYKVRRGQRVECFQLHKPSECRHKLPITKKHIHKCATEEREYVLISEKTGFRKLYMHGIREYPLIMDNEEYNKLKKAAKIVTQEEQIKALKESEELAQKQIKASEERIKKLKVSAQKQPGEVHLVDTELTGPDQTAHTMSRAEVLIAENFQGPKMCNRIILASKCHAIRDAQVSEKHLIEKELLKEERRLDRIMEENRVAAIERAEAEEQRRHNLRLENLAALKEQIKAHEVAKVMEAERIEEESVRLNQANIAIQMEEAKRQKDKHKQKLKLKQMLDEANAELLYFKQMELEENRIMDLRIKNFEKAKMEREAKAKAEADALQAARMKGTEHIAKAQKAEQEMKNELERIRNLKIREDVEREFRRKERAAAIKKNRDLQELHNARKEQINGIHKMIAREIAKDEQAFNDACKQNQEYMEKQKLEDDKRKAAIEKHRQGIMKQINEKEVRRAELREKTLNEGVALRMEQEQQDKYELRVIKMKLDAMRQQKVPEKYVKEVEQTLGTHGYKV